MINVSTHFIKIKVVGSGFGESILINISDYFFLGIDCNKNLLYKADEKTVLEGFIENCQKKYWILSHYHLDHYNRFVQIFENFKIEKVIVPQDFSSKDFIKLIKSDAKKNTGSEIEGKKAEGEYSKLSKLVSNLGYNGFSFIGKCEFLKCVISDRKGVKKELRVKVYGLTSKMEKEIKSSELSKALNNSKYATGGEIINYTSYITYITYGDFQGIFFADAPLERINSCLANLKSTLNLDFIKIGHHGSKTSSNYELVKKLNSNKKLQTAIVTPFLKSKLPSKEVMKNYMDLKFNVQNTYTYHQGNVQKKEKKLCQIPNEHRIEIFSNSENSSVDCSYYKI
ncbi:hypothetical protein WIW50_15030 [Flavobacteriaceae bacterium 3-367]